MYILFCPSTFVPLSISIYHYLNRHIMIQFYLNHLYYTWTTSHSKLSRNHRVSMIYSLGSYQSYHHYHHYPHRIMKHISLSHHIMRIPSILWCLPWLKMGHISQTKITSFLDDASRDRGRSTATTTAPRTNAAGRWTCLFPGDGWLFQWVTSTSGI